MKKFLFIVVAMALPLVLAEGLAYVALKLWSPQLSEADLVLKKKGFMTAVRQDYNANDHSRDDYDYAKDAFGPYLNDARLKLPRRLIGPAAYQHYLNVNRYTLFPFTMFHFQRHYRSKVVNTNSLGFRARELDDYANDPKPKILILGGSAVFGFNVTSDEATISAQLERYLEARGYPVTCINLAMGGYTAEQEMITLGRIGLRLQPQMVIAIDGGNDIIHGLAFRDGPWNFQPLAEAYYLREQQDRQLVANSPRFYLKGLVHSLARYSYVLALADRLTDRLRAGDTGTPQVLVDPCALFSRQSDGEAIVANYLNAHRVMAELCRGRGIRYRAALQPMCGLWVKPRWEGEKPSAIAPEDPFYPVFMRLDEGLKALARDQGFPSVNLGQVLAASDNIYNFSDSIHLTDKSCALIAQYLGDDILKNLDSKRPAGR